MYIPKDILKSTIPNERIAIIGPPGAGKTTSLLTFPNLIVADVDHKCPSGMSTIPMWNPEWADSLVKRTDKNSPNFRDAIKKWLRENFEKFEPEQTFAMDSWSFVQDACDLQTHVEEDLSAKADGYFFYKWKLRYSKELMDYIKKMKCRVVVTFHETRERNPDGSLSGKIKPVQDGQYKDVILGNFTDVWRARANVPILDAQGKPKRDANGKVQSGGFIWQVAGDSVVDLNTNPTLGRILRSKDITTIPIVINKETNVITGGYQTIQELYASYSGVNSVEKQETK